VPYIVRILDPNWVAAFALAATIAHWFPLPLATIEAYEELEETKGKLLVVLDDPELHRRTLSPSLSLRKKGTPLRALLRSPPPPNIPTGEFTVPRRPRRARPHRERLAVVPGPPHRSSGRGAAARCVAPPPSLTGATVSRPRLDRRPRLDHKCPFILIKSEPFNQSSMTQVRYWSDKISAVRFNL
jgi:hypothetical protein